MTNQLSEKILKLKKEKNAIILAHLYQIPEIQEIADYVGDSYYLSQVARDAKEDLIIFWLKVQKFYHQKKLLYYLRQMLVAQWQIWQKLKM